MEIWRARPLLRCIVHSSSALFKNTPRRSFQTLVRRPPVAASSSSSCYLRSCLFVSQPQRRQQFHFFPQAPAVVRTLSSLYSEQQSACSENGGYQHNLVEVEQEKQSRVIPVKAYFLCTDYIYLKSLQAQHAFKGITLNSYSILFTGLETGFGKKSNCQYMIVFQYGSIVLFNVPDHEVDAYLKMVERHASGLLPEFKKADYVVVEKPTLETWVQGGLDSVVLKNLSIDGIGTIGSVLGRSIALDYHIRQVNQMIPELEDINCQIVKNGPFSWQIIKNLQVVWDANSKLNFISQKLEILKRSNITNDAQIWECLSTEFALTKMVSSLDHDLLQAMVRALKLKMVPADAFVYSVRLMVGYCIAWMMGCCFLWMKNYLWITCL